MKISILLPLIYSLWLPVSHAQQPPTKSEPFLVMDNCHHSGYMQEGCVSGIQRWQNYRADSLHQHSFRITATACDALWAGVYWQYPANNWCQAPGVDLSGKGYTRITFEARGEKGDEVVKFMAGNKDCDSFAAPDVVKYLSAEWDTYTISVVGKDLSNLRCPFGWAVEFRNVGNEVTFYLDNIRYE